VAIGHVLSGTVVNSGTDDWQVAFNNPGNPTFRELVYATSSTGAVFVTTTGTVAPVPEPGMLGLIAVGVASLSFRRRRKASQAWWKTRSSSSSRQF
jgi:hypothetical protein